MARREALRRRWISEVAAAPIGNATKALLLYLATRMTATGYVEPISRDDLAKLFAVHPQRIAERLTEARRARLLDQIEGSGVRGRKARYVATLPPRRVPESGTEIASFRTGERYPQIGTLSEPLGTAERYTQHARAYRNARRETNDGRYQLRAVPTMHSPKDRIEARAGSNSSVDAVLRKFAGRRPACTGLRTYGRAA